LTVYNRVVFKRGTGLGNRLFPWARCVIASEQSATPMLAPRWWWPLRKGAILAGGISRSAYLRQGLLIGVFRRRPNEIAGVRRTMIEMQGNTRDFSGEEDRFAGLTAQRTLINRAFRESTREPWLKLASEWNDVVIGINVRRGRDFKDAQKPEDFIYQGGLRTPLDWFVEMLRLMRTHSGKSLPAVVVSDGTEHDLARLLAEPNVRMLRPGCPASDLLVLSQCRVMLGSGGSSFSAWASFLGDVPVYTVPGQSLAWFGLQDTAAVCDPANPSDEFLRHTLTLQS
jgi:hypothetical protein